MLIIPAIDILNGKCVRLKMGEYGSAEKVSENAIETALKFKLEGADYLHIVDLNGAKSGNTDNFSLIKSIVKQSGLSVEVGGGIRNIETVSRYIEIGADRVILGSAALKDSEFLKAACEKFPGHISVGIDAKNGMTSTDGWTVITSKNAFEFASEIEKFGVSNIIYTEIERDGMLCGINADIYRALSEKVSIKITASGGIRDLNDIDALIKTGIYGAICGKSLYSGTLDLKEAVNMTKGGTV